MAALAESLPEASTPFRWAPVFAKGVKSHTCTAAVTLTRKHARLLALDPGGANRDVTLPVGKDGDFFVIFNAADAAEDLVVKNPAAVTLATLAKGSTGAFICVLGTWAVLMAGATSAASMTTDVVAESTPATGVTVDGLRIMDSTIKPVAGGTAFIDLSNVATGEADIILKDNLAVALEIREAANSYMRFVTTNSAELVEIGKSLKLLSSIDFSGNATGVSLVKMADNLASGWELVEAANSYIKAVTTDDAERVVLGKLLADPTPITIDMADATHTLVLGTAGAAQTKLTSRIIFADANSTGTEKLILPAEASMEGVTLDIYNFGGESILVREDSDSSTIVTIPASKAARVACNGTTWLGLLGA